MPVRKPPKKKAPKFNFRARDFFLAPFRIIFYLTSRFSFWLKWPSRIGLSIAFTGGVFGSCISLVYYTIASTYDLEDVVQMPARTEIKDREGNILKNSAGQEIGFLHGKNRRIITYADVPSHFVDALIAQEDKRFRSHGAVDFRSMARVAWRALTRGKLEGGGTLSMHSLAIALP